MYGKTLAHTGVVALAGVTVLGWNVPYLVIGSAAAMVAGGIALRMSGKRKLARTSR